MKTIAMDYKLLVEEVMEIDFKSEVTILDYEIVIWNPNALMENYDSKISNWDGDPLFKTYDSVLINNDTKRRERELKEFLCNNRLFICFTPKPITYNSLNEKNVWKKIEFNIFPEIISTIPARGTNIERKNGNILNEFWSTNEGQMFYEAYISNGSFEPLLFIKGTDKVVGAYKNYNTGYLFFIPTLCDESYYESIEDCREAHKSFYESVISLYKNLFKARKEIVFPEWAIKYSYLEAGAVKSELLDVEKRYNETVSELQLKQSIFNKIEEFKLLFTGTGDLLRDQVKIVFEQLGFEILGSDIGRDDIVMGYNNQPVVVEVKGV